MKRCNKESIMQQLFITGETGVGKEGVARYIHESGPRRDQPFISINCGRFSTEHLQSELFGHEVGAFTSAICQCRGTFEIVDGGILFLTDVARYNQLKRQKSLKKLLPSGFSVLYVSKFKQCAPLNGYCKYF